MEKEINLFFFPANKSAANGTSPPRPAKEVAVVVVFISFFNDHDPLSRLLPGHPGSMPSKHHRPAALQRRSTSESNAKLTLANLNLQKIDSSSNPQLQVALNNATKDLPKGKGKKAGGRPNVCYDSPFQFFALTLILPFVLHRAVCHSNPQVGRRVIKSDHPLNCTCNSSSHTHIARRQAPLAPRHSKDSTRPPQPSPPKNLALLSQVPRLPPTILKARTIQTTGSRARACPSPPRTNHPTRNLVTMTSFITILRTCILSARPISQLPRMIGNRLPQPSLE